MCTEPDNRPRPRTSSGVRQTRGCFTSDLPLSPPPPPPLDQLNAFDSRHLDEIHFDVRLIAFQDATRRIEAMTELDMPYINTILNNCFYTYEVRPAASPPPPRRTARTRQSSPEDQLLFSGYMLSYFVMKRV